MKTHWSALKYSTINLGDDVQTVAAMRFLPRVDSFINRDELEVVAEPKNCILNGWFFSGKLWPPPGVLNPLLTSFHISKSSPSRALIASKESLEWFRASRAPIGCRSYSTLEFFQLHGIESYFSGCLTLTLPPRDVPRSEMIVWVDVVPPAWGLWPTRVQHEITRDSVFVSHCCTSSMAHHERLAQVGRLLDLYAGAKLVVTNRLHVALPCIAYGTPVLFVKPTYEEDRVAPYLGMMSVAISAGDFQKGRFDFDWENPPPPKLPRPLVDDLVERVSHWVACNSSSKSTDGALDDLVSSDTSLLI